MARAKRTFPVLTPQRRNELWGVLFLAGSVFLLMSIVSFTAEDSAFLTSVPSAEPRNLCGVVGVWVASVILIGIGWTGYLLPFLGFAWAVARFNGKQAARPILKGVSSAILLLAASALLHLVWPQGPRSPIPPGGTLGVTVGGRVEQYFGWWGAVVVLLTLSILSLVLSTEFLVWPVLRRLGEWAAGSARWAGRRAGESGAGAWQALARMRGAKATPVHRARPVKVAAEEPPELEEAPEIRIHEPPPVPVSFPRKRESDPRFREDDKSPPRARPAEPARARPAPGPALKTPFQLPSLDLLNPPQPSAQTGQSKEAVEQSAKVLEETLQDFGIEARVAEVEMGPVITRYELEPAPGVKIQRIAALSDDLALALKAASVRVIAPIPGKGRVGIEVPNLASSLVTLREVLESREFRQARSKLTIAVGKDTAGHPLLGDLGGMPHLLIAGATGSGKTVCMNSLVVSLLYNAAPEDVRFLMVDPKMVELGAFNGLPHLLMPVLTSAKKVPAALEWVVEEMESRYRLFAKLGVRNIDTFHQKNAAGQLPADEIPESLPYLVVIIDELADLMLVAQQEVERAIARIAHLSRAVGIHMVLATQRPSVDVLTGVIKANFPARISFQVASRVDSRTVLDAIGAEKLLGKGDLLFMPPGASRLVRGQGPLVTDQEIERVVQFLKQQRPPSYEAQVLEEVESRAGGPSGGARDPMYGEALRVVVESGQASVSLLQRRMRLGYGRAARILDVMEQEGIVGPIRGARPREVFLKEIPGLPRPQGVTEG
ncbi:MAG: DNA translocase FtsK 4TM domain-containing protein [Candidatus Omnitrophica bacterium]|nr:DNA translocase FtsK 4TM domain-containing protein [Candidatus Omnitrophota bacterium]